MTEVSDAAVPPYARLFQEADRLRSNHPLRGEQKPARVKYDLLAAAETHTAYLAELS